MQSVSRSSAWSATSPFLVLAVLGLVCLAGSVAAHAETSHPFIPPMSCQRAGRTPEAEITRVKLSDDVVVERIKGKAALKRLTELRNRQPEAFARARKDLRSHGFVPTEKVYIERTVRLASKGPGAGDPQVVPTQDYGESNADGEILFWSWNDGNDATWEGTIYMDVYSAGAAATWDGQIDTSTEEYPWIYYTKTWEGPGSGGGRPKVDFQGPRPKGPSFSVVSATMTRPGGPRAYLREASFYDWAVCWRACVVGSCIAAAIGCKWGDGLWPGCFGAWCVGAEVGCGVTCFLAK